jgi:enoyl-CoA hydratase/carnithine racemase
MNPTILLTRDGPVATLTLNRPDALNVLDFGMMDALVARTAEVANDDSLQVLVLRGAGKHFWAVATSGRAELDGRRRIASEPFTRSLIDCTWESSNCTRCHSRWWHRFKGPSPALACRS